jgi:hypothetical protein
MSWRRTPALVAQRQHDRADHRDQEDEAGGWK